VDGFDMTPLDHMSPAAATLNQIRYAQEHIEGDEYKNCEDKDHDKNCKDDDDNDAEEHIFGDDDNDSKNGDYKDRGEDHDDDSESVGLFGYADGDYNHLDDDDLNEDERLIVNTDIKKRVKEGCHQGNLITGGPVVPNYDGMSVTKAHDAKHTYLTQRKKFRDGLRRERLQAGKGSVLKDNDYSGDLTPTLRTMTAVSLSRLKPQTWAKLP